MIEILADYGNGKFVVKTALTARQLEQLGPVVTDPAGCTCGYCQICQDAWHRRKGPPATSTMKKGNENGQ
jgi:hypothetical protein